jgi:hypothetical protein
MRGLMMTERGPKQPLPTILGRDGQRRLLVGWDGMSERDATIDDIVSLVSVLGRTHLERLYAALIHAEEKEC